MIKSVYPTKELWVYSSEPNHQGHITAMMLMEDDFPSKLILHHEFLKAYHSDGTVDLHNRVVLDIPFFQRDAFIEHAMAELLSQEEYHEAELPEKFKDFIEPPL